MGHHEHLAATGALRHPIQRCHDPVQYHVVGFIARWPFSLLQATGPVNLNLLAGQALPLAGVTFHEVRFNQHRANVQVLGNDGRRLSGPQQR